jgi:ankyrin repeat protein
VVRVLVSDLNVPVDVKDKEGTTPLMSAADYARVDAVDALLALGADASIAKPDGTLAIHRAASSALADGDPSDACAVAAAAVVKTLSALPSGASESSSFIESKSSFGTPFLCACARGSESCVAQLSALGADATATLPNGVGGAALAAASGAPGALRAALAAGAATAARPEGGMTALHVAASHPATERHAETLVQILLDHGADADAVDGEGMKAIHAASAVGRAEVVRTLLPKTTPDDGVAGSGKNWTAAEVRRATQAKLEAIRKRGGGEDGDRGGVGGRDGSAPNASGTFERPSNEPPIPDDGYDADAFASRGVVDAEKAAAEKRRGDEAFIRGDNATAVEAYASSLACDDANAKVWANRSAARLKLGHFAAAARDAKISRAIDKGYVKAWYREGCALTELGDYESAAVAFFEGMQIDGDNKDLKRGFDDAIARGRKAHAAAKK